MYYSPEKGFPLLGALLPGLTAAARLRQCHMYVVIFRFSRQLECMNETVENRRRSAGAAAFVAARKSSEVDVAALQVSPGALRTGWNQLLLSRRLLSILQVP